MGTWVMHGRGGRHWEVYGGGLGVLVSQRVRLPPTSSGVRSIRCPSGAVMMDGGGAVASASPSGHCRSFNMPVNWCISMDALVLVDEICEFKNGRVSHLQTDK